MNRLEDIMEQARAYLRGEMDGEERQAFKRLLEERPALWEELSLARLMMEGAEELGRRQQRRKRWAGLAVLFLAILVALTILVRKQLGKAPGEDTPPAGPEAPSISRLGGTSPQRNSDRAHAVAWGKDGSLAVTGIFEASAQFGTKALHSQGARDAFLALLSPEGRYDWALSIGGEGEADFGKGVALDRSGNILATGSFGGVVDIGGQRLESAGAGDMGPEDFFIASFTPGGRLRWASHAGGRRIPDEQTGTNRGMSITADPAGNVIATGLYLGAPSVEGIALPAGGPNSDLYLVKYSGDGELRWIRAVTGSYMVIGNDVKAGPEGHIYLTGFFGHHNLGGEATFGGVRLKSYGGRDIFLARYSPDGNLLWVQQAGSSLDKDGNDFGNAIAVDSLQNSYITGCFTGEGRFGPLRLVSAGGLDIFVAKCSPDGDFLWASRVGGSGRLDIGNDISLDREGNSYVTGVFSGQTRFGDAILTSNGPTDIFISKYSPEGQLLWVRQAGGPLGEQDADGGNSIAVNDKTGEVVVTGYFSGTIQLAGRTISSLGREDMLIIRMDKDGRFLGAQVLP